VSVRGAIRSLCAALVVGSPEIAQACSVCSAGRDDEVRAAFVGTTIFLSVLPPVAIGAGVLWLRRRLREMESADSDRA